MIEDCQSLTNLIFRLRGEITSLDQYLDLEQYEKAQSKLESIDSILATKGEFLRWRGYKKSYSDRMEGNYVFNEMKEQLHPGFWPVRVSLDGAYLGYFTEGSDFVRVDLKNGQKNINTIKKTGASFVKCSFFDLQYDGGAYIAGIDGSRTRHLYSLPHNEDYNGSVHLQAEETGNCPRIFTMSPNLRGLGSYGIGNLSSIHPGLIQGDNFDVRERTHTPGEFASITYLKDGKTAVTLDLEGHLDLWNCEWPPIYLKEFTPEEKCLDYKKLDDDLILVLTKQTLGIWRCGPFGVIQRVSFAKKKLKNYIKIAVNREKDRYLAITADGKIDIYKKSGLAFQNPCATLDLSSEFKGWTIKSFDIGIDDKIVISFADGEVAIFEKPKQ